MPLSTTQWNRVLLEKATVAELIKNFLKFMEGIGSLQYSQEPAPGPYPEPE
jgi:hypothetical protein